MKEVGLPYMGSKRKIADKIVGKIINDNPNMKYFYDLFGGGGAVSFRALQEQQIEKVIYNELNTGIVELLKDIIVNGVTDKYYQWVSRETFNANKDKDTWFGGFCKVIWSFGNNQRDYLFSIKIEKDKELLHAIIVNEDKQALRVLSNKIGVEIPKIPSGSLNERRLYYYRFMRLENIERLQQLRLIQNIDALGLLNKIQYAPNLSRLEIQNKSYHDVDINTPVEETVIYLDPPYQNTKRYQNEVDHKFIYNCVKNSKYKVYVSSYEYDLPCVLEIPHMSTMLKTNNKRVIERLFVNKP